MNKSKTRFLLFTVLFLSLLFYASYDIARRTTFPGAKAQLKQRIENKYKKDSLKADTIRPLKPDNF